MKPHLILQSRKVYGKHLAYPHNRLAEVIAETFNVKTFTEAQVLSLLRGFEVSIVPEGVAYGAVR